MNVFAIFVLGLLVGWLAEWTSDWYYWRGRITRFAEENMDLRKEIAALRARKNPAWVSAKNMPLTDSQGNHNFQAIKAVGPVFAKRLKDALCEEIKGCVNCHIRTVTPAEILGSLYKRFFSTQETMLAQAKEFAKQVARQE
jgi:hypothetical protein